MSLSVAWVCFNPNGGFALSADRAASKACCISITTCLHVSRSIHSLTTYHKGADQKGPSTSQIVFQPTLHCVSHNAHKEREGWWHFIASKLSKPPIQSAQQKGFFQACKRGR